MNDLDITFPSPETVCIARTFDATREQIWRAHAEPDLLKRWVTGPPGNRLVTCENDLRPGGQARYVWDGDAGRMGMRATFIRVEEPAVIEHDEVFDEWPEGSTRVRLVLEEVEAGTRLSMTLHYPNQDMRDEVVRSGMPMGVDACWKNLLQVLEDL